MAGFRKALVTAMGLKEDAPLADIATTFTRLLGEDMTPEEKLEMEKAKKEKESADAEMAEHLKAVRASLGLKEDASVKELAEGVNKLKTAAAGAPTDAALALQVKSLGERLEIAEAGAAEAMKLKEVARISGRDLFLSEQVRAGKLIPSEKDFFIQMWDKDEAATRKYFADKKAVVRLSERGTDLPGKEFNEEKDPRETMKALADKRATEKSIDFVKALNEIKTENPELVEQVATMYGPPTR